MERRRYGLKRKHDVSNSSDGSRRSTRWLCQVLAGQRCTLDHEPRRVEDPTDAQSSYVNDVAFFYMVCVQGCVKCVEESLRATRGIVHIEAQGPYQVTALDMAILHEDFQPCEARARVISLLREAGGHSNVTTEESSGMLTSDDDTTLDR